MSRLPNERNDLYARHRARGMLPSKAALAAGYAAGSSTTHLEQDPEIVARIAEYMDEFQAHREQQRIAAHEAAKVVGSMTGVGRSWVIQQLAEIAGLAKNDQDYKEANRALELIGKEMGMFSGGSGEDPSQNVPTTLDMDKLASVLDRAHDALPVPAADPDRTFDPSVAMDLIEGQSQLRTVRPTEADDDAPLSQSTAEESDEFDRVRREIDGVEDED
jgi:hypothetical protein